MKKSFRKSLILVLVLSLLTFIFTPAVFAYDEPGWKSGDGKTHRYILGEALEIVQSDKGYTDTSILYAYKDTLLKYCDMPDKDELWYASAYHFYNPHTGYNYYPWPTPKSIRRKTAMVMFKEHSADAVSLYNEGKYAESFEKLGRAIHYLEDANVPHHAGNKIFGLSNHSSFEQYAYDNQERYRAETCTIYEDFNNISWMDYCYNLLHKSALHAYDYLPDATYTDGNDYEDYAHWDKAAHATVENAQEAVAAYLYNFLREVGYTN